MKRQWTLYIVVIFLLLLSVSIHGYAASDLDGAVKMASNLAADYRVLCAGVPFGMDAGAVIIEARLPIGGTDEQTLTAILDTLPREAATVIVSDRFHEIRWLHITCPSAADSIYENALDVLTALGPVSLDTVQLSLNVSWYTSDCFSTAKREKMIASLFASMEARAIADMADGRIVSASGFSPRLSGRAGAGGDAMNLTASLCTDPSGGSILWLGTPVLTVEY